MYLTRVLNDIKEAAARPKVLHAKHLFKLNEAVFNMEEEEQEAFFPSSGCSPMAQQLFQTMEKIHQVYHAGKHSDVESYFYWDYLALLGTMQKQFYFTQKQTDKMLEWIKELVIMVGTSKSAKVKSVKKQAAATAPRPSPEQLQPSFREQRPAPEQQSSSTWEDRQPSPPEQRRTALRGFLENSPPAPPPAREQGAALPEVFHHQAATRPPPPAPEQPGAIREASDQQGHPSPPAQEGLPLVSLQVLPPPPPAQDQRRANRGSSSQPEVAPPPPPLEPSRGSISELEAPPPPPALQQQLAPAPPVDRFALAATARQERWEAYVEEEHNDQRLATPQPEQPAFLDHPAPPPPALRGAFGGFQEEAPLAPLPPMDQQPAFHGEGFYPLAAAPCPSPTPANHWQFHRNASYQQAAVAPHQPALHGEAFYQQAATPSAGTAENRQPSFHANSFYQRATAPTHQPTFHGGGFSQQPAPPAGGHPQFAIPSDGFNQQPVPGNIFYNQPVQQEQQRATLHWTCGPEHPQQASHGGFYPQQCPIQPQAVPVQVGAFYQQQPALAPLQQPASRSSQLPAHQRPEAHCQPQPARQPPPYRPPQVWYSYQVEQHLGTSC